MYLFNKNVTFLNFRKNLKGQIWCQNARIQVFDSSLTTNLNELICFGRPCFFLAPQFYPIWFAQNSPFSSLKTSMLGSFQSFNLVFSLFLLMGQSKWLIPTKKKKNLKYTPHLINETNKVYGLGHTYHFFTWTTK